MLMIRFQRIGKRGQAYFRLVATEHTSKPQGKYLELLGTYDPHAKKLVTKTERIAHWREHGAKLSATAHNLLVTHKVLDEKKVPSWKPKKSDKDGKGAPVSAPAV